jgi:DNA-binding NarL/FixJ family response regulator
MLAPKEIEGDAPDRAIANSTTAGLALSPARPLGGDERQHTEEGHRRSRLTSVRKAAISVGVIDEKSFTRECITRCLRTSDNRLDIVAFATCDDFLRTMTTHDVVLLHIHEDFSAWTGNNHKLAVFKQLLNIAPVIILSDITNPNLLTEIFESGARGVIPTADTTLEQMIEIIGLVKVGGIFVPLSSLSLRIKGRAVAERAVSNNQFTRSELAILDRLKLGKANKIIAHELGVSESTVKVHIGRIMRKLKVTNRTQIVSRAYAWADGRTPPTDEL